MIALRSPRHPVVSWRCTPPGVPHENCYNLRVVARRNRRHGPTACGAQAKAADKAADEGTGALSGSLKGFALLNIAAALFGSNQVTDEAAAPESFNVARRKGRLGTCNRAWRLTSTDDMWRTLQERSRYLTTMYRMGIDSALVP